MRAEPRPLTRPAADADVDVVALGEDPAVAAGHRGDLERHRVRVAHVVREVRLERDAVDDLRSEAERLRARAVAAVGHDDDAGIELARVDGDALPDVGARVTGALEEEMVEPSSLRHVRERRPRRAREVGAVVEAALETIDDVLDDRVDRERE